jgi:nucleoid DNA-binding protein
MTKQEMAEAIATKTNVTQKSALSFLNAFIETVNDAISKKGAVKLIGFGTFTVKQRAARAGRNPQTGKPLQIPAKIVPVFRPGTDLKEAAATP